MQAITPETTVRVSQLCSSDIKKINPRRINWTGYVTHIGEINSYKNYSLKTGRGDFGT
jgi:hypothetical protein